MTLVSLTYLLTPWSRVLLEKLTTTAKYNPVEVKYGQH